MKNLSKKLTSEALKNRNEILTSIRQIETKEAQKLEWYLSNLLPATKKKTVFYSVQDLKSYLVDRLEKHTLKKIESLQNQLVFNENLETIKELIINVEWKKSSMWGMNPTAEAYVPGIGRISSGSIGGCGYDKQSTAVANVLNQVPQFLKLMYLEKNKANNQNLKNHLVFAYGSGYGILPSFEGGVGVNCYNGILNKIGY